MRKCFADFVENLHSKSHGIDESPANAHCFPSLRLGYLVTFVAAAKALLIPASTRYSQANPLAVARPELTR